MGAILNRGALRGYVDLLINLLLTILALVANSVPSLFILRTCLGYLLAYFVPGYALTCLLYPLKDKEMGAVERLLMAVGFSIVIITITGLLLNYTYGVTRVNALLSLFYVSWTLTLLAMLRRGMTTVDNHQEYSFRTFKTAITVLCVIGIALTGLSVRYLPHMGYSYYGGGYGPYSLYIIAETIRNSRLITKLPPEAMQFARGALGVLNYRGNILKSCLIYLLTGLSPLKDAYLYGLFSAWIIILTLPPSLISLCKKITNRSHLSTKKTLLLYLLFTLPTFDYIRITYGGADFYLLMTLALTLIFSQVKICNVISALLFSLTIPLLYYTSAIVFLLILLSLAITSLIRRKRNFTLFLVTATYLLGIMTYFTLVGFRLPFSLASSLLNISSRLAKIKAEELYAPLTVPLWWLTLYVANGLSILIPILIIAMTRLLRRELFHEDLGWILALMITFLAFWIWGGLRGAVARTMEYVPLLIAPPLFSLLTGHRSSSLSRVTAGLIIVSIITSSLTYSTNRYLMPFLLTWNEVGALKWFASLPYREKGGVFTDFRLGTPLMLFGELRITGIRGAGARDLEYLKAIYYSDDPYMAYYVLIKHYKTVNYLLISKGMLKPYPGIVGWWRKFRPMTYKAFMKYEIYPGFSKVYSNDECFFYQLKTSNVADKVFRGDNFESSVNRR